MKYPGKPVRAGSNSVDAVRALQQRLNAVGAGRAEGGEEITPDGVFGPETEAAVRLFQARTGDAREEPLVVDGEVGPLTWAALFGAKLEEQGQVKGEYLQRVLATARKEIGTLEQPLGSNRGPKVDGYLETAGCPKGVAWCAAFVYWCFEQAREAEANPAPKTGGVHEMWRQAGKTGKWRLTPGQAKENPGLVVPGQLFLLDAGGGKGHIGFIAGVKGTYLTTIEGNTNPGGGREGIGVFERSTRRIAQVSLGFADLTRAAAG